MPHGRPTNDPKRDSIRVRLNNEMRDWLFQKSQKEKKTVSQIIRDIITRDMQIEPAKELNPQPTWWKLKG